MSQENVENVRAAYEAIARRDRTALEALITEHVATDFEYEAFLTGRTYQAWTASGNFWTTSERPSGSRRTCRRSSIWMSTC
jgi:ketosteroid isomerase-like protein